MAQTDKFLFAKLYVVRIDLGEFGIGSADATPNENEAFETYRDNFDCDRQVICLHMDGTHDDVTAHFEAMMASDDTGEADLEASLREDEAQEARILAAVA